MSNISLYYAAVRNDVEKLRVLLRSGAHVDAYKDSIRCSALNEASFRGQAQVTKALMYTGADIESSNVSGNTALLNAASRGKLAAVRLLATAGARVEHKNYFRKCALHGASLNGYACVVKALIDAGANVESSDISGDTPLLHAARYGKLDAT